MIARFRSTLLIIVLTCCLSPASAAGIPMPEGQVILTVTGAIDGTNDSGTAVFDLASFESLGLTEIRTDTPWTDSTTSFEGVLVHDLIARVGAAGTNMRAIAWDDYTISIPLSDFDTYGAILATRRNGDPMQVRDKGPIWIIYPWSDFPELQNEENYAKAIWQVRELIFE